MREIKFRAWDDTLMQMFPVKTLEELAKGDYSVTNWYQLTIMQYIGLKDKNGKEMYEGDIMKHSEGDGKFPIEWCPDVSGFSWGIWQGDEDAKEWEIIGNIHENPELISHN